MVKRITQVDTGRINWSEVSSLNDISGFGRLTDGRSPNTYLDTSTMEYRNGPRFSQTLGAILVLLILLLKIGLYKM